MIEASAAATTTRLQFMYDKRYSNGLAYQVSYTYSKTIDIGSDGWYGVEGFSVQNPYTYNNDRSIAGYDLTHVLSVNLVYELPIGKGKPLSTHNSVLDYIIGGWQVNAIASAHSGSAVQHHGRRGYRKHRKYGTTNAPIWLGIPIFPIVLRPSGSIQPPSPSLLLIHSETPAETF